jgi:hypothetical protein
MHQRAMRVAVTCAVGLALAGPQLVSAAATFNPTAAVGVEYNSNLFAGAPGPGVAAGSSQADTTWLFTGGANAGFNFGKDDDVGINAVFKRLVYDRFTYLTHNEYSLGGHFAWQLGPVINVELGYTFNRYMAPFADILTTQLVLNTDHLGSVTVHVLLSPEWRLDLSPKYHELDSPLPGYPDFQLQEKSGSVSLNYLGIAQVTAGTYFTYDEGSYSQIVDATRFHETDAGLQALYKVSGFSDFVGQLGYSVRNTGPNAAGSVAATGAFVPENIAGVIGTTTAATYKLFYNRELTPKTGFTVGGYREINSFVAGANAQVNTGGVLGAHWAPDVKLKVSLDFKIERDAFVGNVVAQQNFPSRVDVVSVTNAEVKYTALPWLNARAYMTYSDRNSNYQGASYTGWILGFQVTGRLP